MNTQSHAFFSWQNHNLVLLQSLRTSNTLNKLFLTLSYIQKSTHYGIFLGFPGGTSVKEPTCQCRRHKKLGFNPWVWKIPWKREWLPTPVFLPGGYHGQRSLMGYSPLGHKELDTTERLQTHIHNVFLFSVFHICHLIFNIIW